MSSMSDDFFKRETCQRCGGSLEDGRIMSVFNTDCICMKCRDAEAKLPSYKKAKDAEIQAVLSGNYNFPGIGYPKDESVQ